MTRPGAEDVSLAAVVLGLLDDIRLRLPRDVAVETRGVELHPAWLKLSVTYASAAGPLPPPGLPLTLRQARGFLTAHDRPVRLDTDSLLAAPPAARHRLDLQVALTADERTR
jgi:hypothetical protein